MLRVALCAALLSFGAAASAEDVIYVVRSGFPPAPLLKLDAGELHWADGSKVELKAEGSFFVTENFGPGEAPLAAGSVVSLLFGEVLAGNVATDRVVLVKDGERWVLADSDTEPTSIPLAPASIRVPLAPSPEEPGAEDAMPVPRAAESIAAELQKAAMELAREGKRAAGETEASEATAALRSVFEEPETLNALLDDFLGEDHGFAFLRGVDWKFKSFEANGETSLGIEFSYEKSRELKIKDTPRGVQGLGFDAELSGNLAFERSANAEDFLNVRFGLDYFRSSGGVRQARLPLEGDTPEKSALQAKAVELANKAATYTDDAEFLGSPEWAELKELARSVFTTQVYWDFGLDAGFESDQTFSETQFTVGAHAALDIKAWNDTSAAAFANVVDYPAAALRLLTGYDHSFQPRGNTIPTLVLHLDHVEPDGDTPRALAGDSSAYRRLRGEVVYKAPIGRLRGDDYFLLAQFVTYYEIDAKQATRAAELDYYDYLTLSIEADEGPFVTYSKGRQPFDDEDANIYELGWKLHF